MRTNALRSSQLDGTELDEELHQILKPSGSGPTTDALIELVVLGSEYGLKLQNLTLSHSNRPLNRQSKILYYLGRFATYWMTGHLKQYKGERYRDVLGKIEVVIRSLTLLNFITFLWNGRYRSLFDRVFGVSLMYREREMSRLVSYEYMDRQLVWTAFTEFFLVAAPLVDLPKLRRMVVRGIGADKEVDEGVCMFCAQMGRAKVEVCEAYVTNCKHSFCYYCLQSNMMNNPYLKCPRCYTTITDITPLN